MIIYKEQDRYFIYVGKQDFKNNKVYITKERALREHVRGAKLKESFYPYVVWQSIKKEA